RYSKVPATKGARNSPNRPFESENAPLDTGLARLPERPAVAVTVPPTPAVSGSSSAYTPASGNASSCRWASARPRVGRSPSSVSLPAPYALRSASRLTRAAESVTVSSVGRSRTQTSPGSCTASESRPTARTVPPGPGRRAKRPPARKAPPPPTRERANHVSESSVPRPAAAAPENPSVPYARESSVASSENVGVDSPPPPGCHSKRARPAGSCQPCHATRSRLARISTPSESSEPPSVATPRAEPVSGRIRPGAGSAPAALPRPASQGRQEAR